MDGFHAIAAAVDYPVYVVTAAHPATGERAGCLVGFTTQCSIDPPRFLACLSKANRTYRVAQRAEGLAVHLLASSQRALAELFGGETGDDTDKFSRCAWRDGPFGAPVLTEAPAWFAGHVLERADLGDHVGFVLEPCHGEARGDLGPFLTFHAARTIEPGHPA